MSVTDQVGFSQSPFSIVRNPVHKVGYWPIHTSRIVASKMNSPLSDVLREFRYFAIQFFVGDMLLPMYIENSS